MLSAIVSSPRRVELRPLPPPEPGPGQVRVRVEGCGVCGSDLPVWLGRPWFEYPREPGAPGHEAWGTVDAVGPRVPAAGAAAGPLAGGISVGARVTGLTYRSYAEFDVADADALVPLPDKLRASPFPGEPLACAVNVIRRSAIEPGDSVAIVGVGFLGSLLVQLALARGAEVIAISRRALALELAESVGARVLQGERDDLVAAVGRMTSGHMCDVAIEAAGAQATLDLAAQLVRVRGRLVIAGYHQDGPRTVNMQHWNWNGIDVVNAHERDPAIYREGLEQAVAAVAAGTLDPEPLYTHAFALDELDEAFGALEQHPDSFMKALVWC
jgi:2-desacetyl-2-hydroxyethyl bacteriochlorophyllide A dehydrogenase